MKRSVFAVAAIALTATALSSVAQAQVASTSSAQPFKFGVSAGVSFPTGDYRDIARTYGDPEKFLRGDDDTEWRKKILVAVTLPAPLRYSGTQKFLTRVWVHSLVAPSLRAVFSELAESGAWRHLTDCAGTYAFRLVRGGRHLSLHAFGAAIDLNAEALPLGHEADPASGYVREVVPIFESHGWAWGGHFARQDPMHWEAVRRPPCGGHA